MLSLKFAIAPLSALACIGLCCGLGFGQAAPVRGSAIANPTAVATNADVGYCFARRRGLDPGLQPPAYLVAQLRVRIAYRNAGTRPIILPLENERTVFIGLMPDGLSIYRERLGLLAPSFKALKELPAGVGPDSPVSPKNDIFTVIPLGGEMETPRLEEITLPVTGKTPFKGNPDLRGRKLYVRFRFLHRDLAPALKAKLSDRWARIGVLWTGDLTTNTFAIDIPTAPQASPCTDAADHTGVKPDEGK